MSQRLLILVLAILLCGFVVSSRLAFKFPFLYSWDSVQFALSIEDYDVIKHQPHPPGYPLYSLILKIVDRFISNPNLTMIAINIASSIIACFFLFLLVFELTAGTDSKIRFLLSFGASAMYSTNPIVWFYGCVAEIYAVEGLLVAALIYLLVISYSRPHLMPLTSILFGLAGGIRLTTEFFLLPAYLFVFFTTKRKTLLLSIVCILSSNLLWFLPIVSLSGGVDTYLGAVLNQGARESSITAGFKPESFLEISLSLIQGITLPLLVLLLTRIATIRIRARESLLLTAILPALFFFVFIHYPKYGYLLALLPTVIALSVSFLQKTTGNFLVVLGILSLSVISNYCIFTKPPIYTTAEVQTQRIKRIVYKLTFPNEHSRNVQAERFKSFFAKVAELGNRKKLFVVDKGHFPNFRIIMYYYPNDTCVTLLTKKRATIAREHKTETVRQPILLRDERIVVLIGPKPTQVNFRSFDVYEHTYYYAYLRHLPEGFRIYSFQFFKR